MEIVAGRENRNSREIRFGGLLGAGGRLCRRNNSTRCAGEADFARVIACCCGKS